jgi:hypothetical protein
MSVGLVDQSSVTYTQTSAEWSQQAAFSLQISPGTALIKLKTT